MGPQDVLEEWRKQVVGVREGLEKLDCNPLDHEAMG
jgi:hypothetical protein